eukprot:gene6941-7721_t
MKFTTFLTCFFGLPVVFATSFVYEESKSELVGRRKLLSTTLQDDCGKPTNQTSTVVSCFKGYYANAFISKCRSYPSQPRNLRHAFHYNVKTKDLSLELKWDPPEYGLNTLWGYEVQLSGGQCFQINGKGPNHRNFTFHNMDFGSHYLLIISTLPRQHRDMSRSIEKMIQFPEKCKTYKKANLQLPLKCQIVKNFRVEKTCNGSGAALLSWDKPTFNHDRMYIDVECACTKTETSLKIPKNASSKWLLNLKSRCHYTALIYAYKVYKSEFSRIQNLTLFCKEKSQARLDEPLKYTKKPSINKNTSAHVKAIIYLLPISLVILLAIGIGLVLLYFRRKKKLLQNFSRLRAQGGETSRFPNKQYTVINYTDSNKNNELDLKAPSCMILHSYGCRDVDNFVLLFANFLNSHGINTRLDLLETREMAAAGTASYLETTEREVEYVIVVCTKDLECEMHESNKPLRFVLNIIRNNILSSQSCSKYIPTYIDSLSYVPSCLKGACNKVPDNMEAVIQRVLDIPKYEMNSVRSTTPVKNELGLDEHLLGQLKLAANKVSMSSHPGCDPLSCSKVNIRLVV